MLYKKTQPKKPRENFAIYTVKLWNHRIVINTSCLQNVPLIKSSKNLVHILALFYHYYDNIQVGRGRLRLFFPVSPLIRIFHSRGIKKS